MSEGRNPSEIRGAVGAPFWGCAESMTEIIPRITERLNTGCFGSGDTRDAERLLGYALKLEAALSKSEWEKAIADEILQRLEGPWPLGKSMGEIIATLRQQAEARLREREKEQGR